MRRNLILPILAVFVIVGALMLVYGLFATLYGAGEGFPAYSSMNSRPSGTEILYKAVDNLEAFEAERRFEPMLAFEPNPSSTLLIAGALPTDDPVSLLEDLEAFVSEGGHLIVTFTDVRDDWDLERLVGEDAIDVQSEDEYEDEEIEKKDAGDSSPLTDEEWRRIAEMRRKFEEEQEEEQEEDMSQALMPMENAADRWGFKYGISNALSMYEDVTEEDGPILDARRADNAPETMPASYPWYSRVYFQPDDNETWRVLYESKRDEALLMERDFGAGRIVLASDSYFLSNEAMFNDRAPKLIEHVLLQRPLLLFEESHLGIGPNPGIMSLANQYRLAPLVWASVLLVLLFAWRSATSLLPRRELPPESESGARAATTLEGMTQLLHRSIPQTQLIDRLVAAWDLLPPDARAGTGITNQSLHDAVEAARRGEKSDIVSQYNTICATLQERTYHRV